MTKELIIAIVVGICMGAVVTYGVYTANQAIMQKQGLSEPQTTTIPTPVPTPLESLLLRVLTPEPNVVYTDDSVTIKGSLSKEATIAIITEKEQLFQDTDADGSFSVNLSLVKGSNNIRIIGYDGNQVSDEITLPIVYSDNIDE